MNKLYFVKGCICMSGISLILLVGCQKEGFEATDEPHLAIESPTARQCATHTHHESLMTTDLTFQKNQQFIEDFTTRFVAQYPQTISTRAVVTIPVVVHVVYRTAVENISDAQINSQIALLNADFRKTNADRAQIPTIFKDLAADCEINFVLAQIVRQSTTKKSFAYSNDGIKKVSLGGSAAVSSTTKLNIWVGTLGGGLLGYAQFPGGAAATDGVVCLNTAFGNTGTATAPFNQGRTLTHEVGHWFNLRHIWGDAACGSDFVNDTPSHNAANYSCPQAGHQSTCIGKPVEMTMNYMDYTDDACMYFFSAGQKARMQATLATGGARYAYIQR